MRVDILWKCRVLLDGVASLLVYVTGEYVALF